jgi:heme a synthase
MQTPQSRRAWLRRLAWACAVLVLAITSLSAYIRLSRAGIGCAPWPQCREQRAALAGEALAQLDPPPVVAARVAHRIVASTTLLLLIALLMLTLASQPVLWPQGRLVLGLLVLAVLLAGLGRVGGASRAPPVVLGNLLGGFAMVSLVARLLQATGPGPRGVPALRCWSLAALALVLAQAALGGLVSAGQLADRCDAAGLCGLHRAAGLALAALLLVLAAAAWRRGARAVAGALGCLVALQAALGAWQLAQPVPLALALAHNLAAALLPAALLALLPLRGEAAR